MRRRSVICLLLTVILLTGFPAQAQQPKKVYRIGYLDGSFHSRAQISWMRSGNGCVTLGTLKDRTSSLSTDSQKENQHGS